MKFRYNTKYSNDKKKNKYKKETREAYGYKVINNKNIYILNE